MKNFKDKKIKYSVKQLTDMFRRAIGQWSIFEDGLKILRGNSKKIKTNTKNEVKGKFDAKCEAVVLKKEGA